MADHSVMELQNTSRGLNPITNLIFLICIITLLFTLPHPVYSLLFLILIITLYGVAGVELGSIMKKIRFLVYFSAVIFLIQFLFTPGDVVLFTLIPHNSPVFAGALPITTAGVYLGFSMTLRFLVIVFASFLFISITDPNKLAYSLMQLGLPYRYGFMLVTSLRFIPQFEIESNTVRNAQLTRGIELNKSGIKNAYHHVRYTLRPLIFSALNKAETLSRSMEGRGFGAFKTRTFIDKSHMTKMDISLSVLMVVFTLAIIFLSLGYLDFNEYIEILITNTQ